MYRGTVMLLLVTLVLCAKLLLLVAVVVHCSHYTLQLSGNSIGFDGGRCLARSINYWPLHRSLGTHMYVYTSICMLVRALVHAQH
jgi:hypothetical protein